MLRISAQLIKDEFDTRGIPNYIVSEKANILRYQTADGLWHLTRSSLPEKTPGSAVAIARNKLASDEIARACEVPVLPIHYGEDEIEIAAFIARCGSVVVKPLDASHGQGITLGITDLESYRAAAERALQYSDLFFLQQQITGEDYRLFMIDYELGAATRRDHAYVIGDGASSLAQLIDAENQSQHRSPEYGTLLHTIDVEAAQFYLKDAYEHKIPAKEERVQVVGVANIGAGGVAVDVTATVPDAMVQDAKRLLEYINMPTAGVDFMTDAKTGQYYFIEVNASPNFSMHMMPNIGLPQPVAQQFVDWLMQA